MATWHYGSYDAAERVYQKSIKRLSKVYQKAIKSLSKGYQKSIKFIKNLWEIFKMGTRTPLDPYILDLLEKDGEMR